MTIMDCKTCDISSFPIETIYNPFFVFLQALFFGGEEKLPAFLARHTIPGLGIVVDPCAAVLILIVTVLLCIGIKEVCSSYLNICNPFNLCLDNSFFVILFYYYFFFLLPLRNHLIFQSTLAQTIVTTVNVSALLFIIIAGGYLGFKTGWIGYEIPSG